MFRQQPVPIALILALGCVSADTYSRIPAQSPEFEVASVRLAPERSGRGARPRTSIDKAKVVYSNISLLSLVALAWDMDERRIAEGPEWFGRQRYDVAANLPPGATEKQIPLMLQRLLAERFGLVLRRETRLTPVFDLVVAAKGPKLKKADPSYDEGGNFVQGGRLGAWAISMGGLASLLTVPAHRLVLDKTGLNGLFELDLYWTPDDGPGLAGGPGGTFRGAPPGAQPGTQAGPPPVWPSLFTALQEQLGLKLESHKERVEFLVFVSANRVPVEN